MRTSFRLPKFSAIARRPKSFRFVVVTALIAAAGLLIGACGSDAAEAPAAAADETAADQPVAAEPELIEEPAAAPEPTTPPTATSAPEPEPEPTAVPDPLLIETALGQVRGASTNVGVNQWTAMPYAAPPTGDNRWRAPQPHDVWTDEFDATTQGLMCPQPGGDITTDFLVSPPIDEDCLTLSVWAPEDADGLPVMVWIHGGGLTSGSAHQNLYDGTDLSANGVVYVAINYRLGTLGFLAHPEAADEDPEGRSGNYGIMDQQAALTWVQDNIAAFGGDPGNVTLFGESAGGFSICAHLASPASAGLFHKAIIESGGGCQFLQPLELAFEDTEGFVATTGCVDSDLACLRGLPVEDLAVASGLGSLVDDGVLLDQPAIELARAGELNDIPIITGSNQDEFTIFTIGAPEPTDVDLLVAIEDRFGGAAAADIAALYDDPQFDTNLAKLQAALNDATFTCSAEQFAQDLAAAGGTAYRYYFSYVSAQDPFGLGATHGAEMVFLFNNPGGISGLPPELDPVGAELSAGLQSAWTSFAADGAPVGPIAWTPTDESAPVIMRLDETWAAETQIRDGRCDTLIDAWG